MKITLKQHGGLAAAVRRPPLILDTAELGDRRDEVEGLARAVSAQSTSPGLPHPDAMGYTLIIAGADGTHEVRGMDNADSPEFSSLVQQVRRSGRAGAA
jgi:hypothetical protein